MAPATVVRGRTTCVMVTVCTRTGRGTVTVATATVCMCAHDTSRVLKIGMCGRVCVCVHCDCVWCV